MPRNAWMELPEGPAREFFAGMDNLWWSRGAPSGRRISAELKSLGVYVSQGTVQNLLNGPRLPRWETVAAVVRHLAGDPAVFLALWRAAAQSAARTPSPPSTRTQPARADSAPPAIPPQLPDVAGALNLPELDWELVSLRRAGLSEIVRIGPHAELERAVKAYIPQDRRERMTRAAALRELLTAAAGELEPLQQRAAEATFGLTTQSAAWLAFDRRRAAAAVFGVSVDRFRKAHERMIISNLAEAVGILFKRSQDHEAGG